MPKHEIEMGAEEVLGHTLPGNPADRMATLAARKYLANKIRRLTFQYDEGKMTRADYDTILSRLNADYNKAEAVLEDFRAQHQQGGN